ncbi:MAG TPA: hypothetical protein VFF64_29920, partial [Candidatus Eremiobacteraceae bacterium]|nr:hypothetical protein [Candidatus Eremiobacteraceae bacterium]
MSEILLGYEVGTGEAVRVPYAHTVVCGQTQASGKTTTLEGMISRADGKVAIAFATKQAESAFAGARRIPPFFRDRADWQFVESILEAMMQERMKYERQWIIRVCKGAQSLEEVAANTERALHGDGKHAKPASGYAAGMYLQLSEYFKLILPELKRLKVRMSRESLELDLMPGLNVMDLTEYSIEMQSLCIASTFEKVYKMRGIISVIPEAWEFIPQGKNTPVKVAAVSLVRKGLGAGNLMWLDSQDIAGVDKPLLKQVGVWILGVQREINEVEHTIAQMPVPKKAKPKPEDVMQLRRGQFYVSFGDVMKRVYVLPRWMPEGMGQRIARSAPSAAAEAMMRDAIEKYQPENRRHEEENVDYKAAYEEAQQENERLKKRLAELELIVKGRLGKPEPQSAPPAASPTPRNGDVVVGDEVMMLLDVRKPTIDVTVRKYTVEMGDDNTQGRLAVLLSEGFLDSPKRIQDFYPEFR